MENENVSLTDEEQWAVESLMRNLAFTPNAPGCIDLERRFYTRLLNKYGADFTFRLIDAIHDGVRKLIPEVRNAKML